MTNPRCFQCGMPMIFGKSMEEHIRLKLPVFCSHQCAYLFPNNGTKEFDDIFVKLRKDLGME